MTMYGLNSDRPALALHNTRALTTTGGDDTSEKKLRDVCEQFEAFLTAQMLKTMRSSGETEGFLEKNSGENIFTAQYDAELSRQLARRGAMGIAQLLYEELKPQLETTETANSTDKAA